MCAIKGQAERQLRTRGHRIRASSTAHMGDRPRYAVCQAARRLGTGWARAAGERGAASWPVLQRRRRQLHPAWRWLRARKPKPGRAWRGSWAVYCSARCSLQPRCRRALPRPIPCAAGGMGSAIDTLDRRGWNAALRCVVSLSAVPCHVGGPGVPAARSRLRQDREPY